MNSYITIQVRVAARTAQAALQGVKADVASVAREADASRSALGGLAANIRPNLWQKFGNQLQWTGRQLERNFTLPLVLAGAAAAKFELDNEKAMTGVTKVYGDGSRVFNRLSKTEIPALGRAFEALSNEFGVNRKEVIDIGAAWAQAGSSGLALAKSVKLTLETMILGEMNATEATQALISIQAQYGQSIEQLSQTVDILNMVENQTGITMQGLIQGFARAAGTARSAGVDVRHLAALLAALTPAAGSAANAGNALKTIFSRLLAPTKQSADVMHKMGIAVNSVTWQSMNGTQRLEEMAQKFSKLSGAQKVLVSTLIGSRFQINRFDVLMRELSSDTGYYARALNSTSDATANYRQRQKELNIVLSSNPQRLKQVWTILQNAMADVIQPLLPAIVYLSQVIVRFVASFNNLDPSVQKLILTGAVMLALVGPIVKYIGALGTLYGTFKFIFVALAKVTVALVKDLYMLISVPISALMTGLGALYGWVVKAFEIMAGLPGLLVKGWELALRGFAVLEAAFAGMGTFFVGILAAVRGFVAVWVTQIDLLFSLVAAGVYTIPEAAAAGLFATLTLFGRFASAAVMILGNLPLAIAKGFALLPASIAMSFRFLLGTFAALRGFVVVWATQMRLLFSLVGAGIYAIPEAAGIALRATAVLFSRFGFAAFSVFRNLPALIGLSMTRVVAVVRTAGLALIDAIDWPITLAVGAALILFATFHKQLAQIWNNIIGAFQNNASGIMAAFKPIGDFFGNLINYIQRAFWSLPQGIQSAMLAVVHVVASAAQAVYHLLQYLNPFAHHSPSLVENTQKGMGKVQEHHKATAETAKKATTATAGHMNTVTKAASAVSNTSTRGSAGQAVPAAVIKSHKDYQSAIQKDIQAEEQSQKAQERHYGIWKTSQQDINALNRALGFLNTIWRQFADQRKAVRLLDPSALPAFDKLLGDLTKLNAVLARQQAAVDGQQRVVDRWQAKLDAANAVVDKQQKRLSDLQATLDRLTNAYQAHQDALNNLASTPINGEKALGDQIFKNGIEQKKLTLAMMKMEDAVGPLDKLQNRMASLQGDIEKMRSEQSSLRQGGAGSEITGVYQQQIDALSQQQKVIQQSAAPLQDMQDQIDALDRKGQELQLLNDISFDPLHKQIDDLVNGMNEMPFDKIIAGIKGQQDAMAALQPQIDAAQKAVDTQQAMVDAANAAKDAIQARYDAEDKSLQTLQDEYSKTSASIQSVTDALNTLGNAAVQTQQKRASKKKGAGGSKDATGAAFDAAAKGNFPDVGGAGKIGREGGLGDQSKLIDQFTQDQANELGKQFGSFDLFGPIKDQWKKLKGWFSDHVMPILGPIGTAFANLGKSLSHVFDGVSASGISDTFKKVVDAVDKFLKPLVDVVVGVVKSIIALFKLIEPDLKHTFDAIVTAFKKIWTQIAPELAKFIPLITPLLQAFKNIAITIGVILSPIILALLFIFKELASVVGHVIGPALNALIAIIAAVLQVIRGALEIIIGLLTGNFSMIWKGIVDLVAGTFKAIGDVISGTVQVIWGIIKGLVEGIVGFFKWLWDELVGHSIIPDMINAIVDWFGKLPGLALDALKALGGLMIDLFKKAWTDAWDAAKAIWSAVSGWFGAIPGHIHDLLSSIVDKMGNLFKSAWNAAWDAAKKVWGDIHDWTHDIPGKIHDLLDNLIDKLGNLFHDAWTAAWDAAKKVWGDIHDWVHDIPGKIHDLMDSLGDKLSGLFTKAWNSAWDAAKSVWSNISDWVGGLGDKITNKAKGMWDGISGAFKSAVGIIKQVWNDFANFWNGLHISTPKIKIPFAPDIPAIDIGLPHLSLFAMAKGGVTNGPALVGEGDRRYAEFVIPTDPSFRSNAMALYTELGRVFGLEKSVLGAMTVGSVKSPVGMASGGIIGAASARATRPAAASVYGSSTSNSEVHIHGNLEFPNIRSGNDAETFIKNLQALAG